MKIVIMAGGLGTRISEETFDKPKPMVLIGKNPIIWHIMNIFIIQGFNDFIISTGYKSEVIDLWLSSLNGQVNIFDDHKVFIFPNFKVTTINTGLNTQTGGRIVNCMKNLGEEIKEATLFEKILRSLSSKFESKVFTIDEKQDFQTIIVVETDMVQVFVI
jgi:glucose-1-phosphate cytidylyltransferase